MGMPIRKTATHENGFNPLQIQSAKEGFPLEQFDIPKLAKQLTEYMLQEKGSDLHLTPDDGKHNLSIRRNGVLEPLLTLHNNIGFELTNHWKVLADLDLTLKKRPQDGSILNKHTDTASFRISTCPTLFGEKLVLRLHPTSATAISINKLGMNPSQQNNYLRSLDVNSGLVLVAGPTGSGKTQTLYATLNHFKKRGLNIVSIEDPVEVNLPGITQINIHAEFSYPNALRTVLRQDPDVLMIGEIRDSETAKIALSAAQTGHLVLASVHAADGYGALLRLQDLGVDLAQTLQSLQVLVSQQLLRILSANPTATNTHDRYGVRQGIFELLTLSSTAKDKLFAALEKKTLKRDITTLLHESGEDCDRALLEHIQQGKTDWTEIQRVYGWEKLAKLSAEISSTTVL